MGVKLFWSIGVNNTVNSYNSAARKIYTLSNIVQVTAGAKHALALDNTGNLYAWGDNSYGQLGIGPSTGWTMKDLQC